ncbi:MAG: putative nucleotidyltransferase substrate binding domain-containing protein [Pseudomonadota bacterium]|nr:putative nucleotidyltransferase substrate binding domain-containing protein [Pseudomonadota bacterium]
MQVTEIQNQLAAHRVFSLLTEAERMALAPQWRCQRFADGEIVLTESEMPEHLGWLVAGTVDLVDAEAAWRLPLRPGELFGAGATTLDHDDALHATATATSEVLFLDIETLRALTQANPRLLPLLPAIPRASRAGPRADAPQSGNVMTQPISSLITRAPVTIDRAQSIREASRRMADAQVSSILLTQDDQLFGLITDRDLRSRVLAAGLDSARPVADIATLAPLTLQTHDSIFDAMVMMARQNIHHVPVLDGTRVVGMVTATDLSRHQSPSAVYLTSDIHKQADLAGLVACSARVGSLQSNLAKAETNAYSTGHIITSVTDAFTVRLIQLAERQLGPAPVPYAWVAAGSQARMEQAARTDQDNCLILSDDYRPAEHGEYFRAFARFVCDGLDACGYVHCPGEMMAMTDQWRQPQARWRQYFDQWTKKPEAMALMLTSVFFDQRAIHGDTTLLHGLREEVLQRTRGNRLFLVHMVGNALKQRPPLGLFGQISVSRGGEHPGTVDLKHGGIVPIVDLARIYSLAGGLDAVNTHDRLEVAAVGGEITPRAARDLREALEFISSMRIAHQTRQIATGTAPDNHLKLDELSSFERGTLKDAFGVVQQLQSVLGQRYYGGRF